MRLRQLLLVLRADLRRRGHLAIFHSRPAGAGSLSAYPTPIAVLNALDDRDPRTFQERERMLRELLTEHRNAADDGVKSTWASLLVLAFAPMLCALRRRLRGNDFRSRELDQLVIEGVLEALERCPLDASIVCRRIRLDTQRFVIRTIVAEHRRQANQERLSEQASGDPGFVPFEWRVKAIPRDDDERSELEDLLRFVVADAVAEPRLAIVIQTRIWQQPLTNTAGSSESTAGVGPNARARKADAGSREYERVKRQRTRTLTTLRALLRSRLRAGDWRLEAGDWRPETGGRRLEAGDWRPETGGRRLEAGDWRNPVAAPCCLPPTAYSMRPLNSDWEMQAGDRRQETDGASRAFPPASGLQPPASR